jgi:hypothetical protein
MQASVDRAKPANSRHFKTGHSGERIEASAFYRTLSPDCPSRRQGHFQGQLWGERRPRKPRCRIYLAIRRGEVAEGGGLLNRTGFHQALPKQAKTRDFLSISIDINSVPCLPMRRKPSRSLHNLLHGPKELRYGKPSEASGDAVSLAALP